MKLTRLVRIHKKTISPIHGGKGQRGRKKLKKTLKQRLRMKVTPYPTKRREIPQMTTRIQGFTMTNNMLL